MTSALAKSTIEQWQSEGLRPTFEDIVKLNALGVKVERCGDEINYGAVPRIAFIGDWMLKEPTVGKRLWMEQAQRVVPQDFDSRLYFTAWALNCPDDELPKMTDRRVIVKEAKRFAEVALLGFTANEILAAVDYALNGNDETDGEEMPVDYGDAKKKAQTPPPETTSYVMSLFQQALGMGADPGVKDVLTLPQLENMVVCMALAKGADVLDGMKAHAAGQFYAAAGKIHTRLMKEK